MEDINVEIIANENEISLNFTDLSTILNGIYTKTEVNELFDTKEPLKSSDDNYVTNAQLAVIQNTSGVNTGDETDSTIISKLGYTPANLTTSPIVSSGSGAPSSIPPKVGDIYIDTTNYKTYVSNGTSSSSDWIKQNGNYTISSICNSGTNPADATTYYFGVMGNLSTGPVTRNIYVQKSGTITKVSSAFICTTAGSNETSSLYLRVNNTTDYLITGNICNTAPNTYVNNSLNIFITAGDYIQFKWITPTWVTNPTGIFITSSILVDL